MSTWPPRVLRVDRDRAASDALDMHPRETYSRAERVAIRLWARTAIDLGVPGAVKDKARALAAAREAGWFAQTGDDR